MPNVSYKRDDFDILSFLNMTHLRSRSLSSSRAKKCQQNQRNENCDFSLPECFIQSQIKSASLIDKRSLSFDALQAQKCSPRESRRVHVHQSRKMLESNAACHKSVCDDVVPNSPRIKIVPKLLLCKMVSDSSDYVSGDASVLSSIATDDAVTENTCDVTNMINDVFQSEKLNRRSFGPQCDDSSPIDVSPCGYYSRDQSIISSQSGEEWDQATTASTGLPYDDELRENERCDSNYTLICEEEKGTGDSKDSRAQR